MTWKLPLALTGYGSVARDIQYTNRLGVCMNQAPQSAAMMRMTPEIAMTSGLVRKLYIVAFREKARMPIQFCEIAELEGFSPGTLSHHVSNARRCASIPGPALSSPTGNDS